MYSNLFDASPQENGLVSEITGRGFVVCKPAILPAPHYRTDRVAAFRYLEGVSMAFAGRQTALGYIDACRVGRDKEDGYNEELSTGQQIRDAAQ
jgi:hypothetical protein